MAENLQHSEVNHFNNIEILPDTNGTETPQIPLSTHVKQTVERYFSQMDGFDTSGLHALVIREVEKPLIEATLEYCGQNQTKASKILGLSRSTLRKKVEIYKLSS
ncbi:MAG: Fis family transcriptional regulator [Methylococcales bacterium]|nr:Fis family transcriptional regulator [Methylococcales bacterium]